MTGVSWKSTDNVGASRPGPYFAGFRCIFSTKLRSVAPYSSGMARPTPRPARRAGVRLPNEKRPEGLRERSRQREAR